MGKVAVSKNTENARQLASDKTCTGCGACLDACPVEAISLVEDADGFLRPHIDVSHCCACGKCGRSCPALRDDHAVSEANHESEPRFFAAQLRDVSLLKEVSSGGASWALTCATLARGGVVYGAVQTDVDRICHRRAETVEEARAFCRSKYLPSDLRGIYKAVRRDLDSGREVLFTGTGCQVAGLNAFLGHAHPGLVTCEVVCHGIPSMLAWRSYRAEKERAAGKRMVDLVFRDKERGWKNNQYRITYADGTKECERSSRHPFHAGYLTGLFYRSSCGSCPYASLPRVADVTLADFWAYEGGLASALGVSLVCVNNAHGLSALDLTADALAVEEVSRETAVASCRHLCRHPVENPQRAAFLDEVQRSGYHAAMRRFMPKLVAKRDGSPVRRLWRMLRGKPHDSCGDRRLLEEYAAEFGIEPVFADTFGGLCRLLVGSSKNALVVSRSRLVLAWAKCRGFERKSSAKALALAERTLALRDAFRLLASKGVPVYFVNRVGKLRTPGWKYAPSALRRMSKRLDFPTMYADPSAYEADLKELFGEKYSPDYVREVGSIPQIVRTGDVCRHEDCAGRLVNVVGGLRVTRGQPKAWTQTIHVYGRCGAFGYAVEDADTMPSQLQRELSARGHDAVRVVNHGLWGGDDECLDGDFLQEVSGFRDGDIVLFYRKHLDPRLMKDWEKCGIRYFDITENWHKEPAAKSCFYDRPGHMNASGYGIVARLVADILIETSFGRQATCGDKAGRLTTPYLTRYLKGRASLTSFDSEVARYVNGVLALSPPLASGQTAGAIVMNCNPFTNGHRRLIERAAGEVDRLYILVVEEDRSVFPFAERLEMVRAGTADIKNVIVAPSGRFVISSLTFPEYFMKDYVKEKEFDVSGDVRTFCEKIAPPLGVSVRFAGAEPFDPVTANYNRCMAELLPRYGLRFREIPRFEASAGEVISATAVRRFLQAGDLDAVSRLVPPSTLDILRRRAPTIPTSDTKTT